jgi:hypothetical protein
MNPAAEIFRKLQDNRLPHSFTAAEVDGHPGVYVAVDAAGRPAIFAKTEELAPGPALRTAHVSLRSGVRSKLTLVSGAANEELFDILACESTEAADHETFLVLADAFLAQSSGTSGREPLVRFFRSLVRLFGTEHARDVAAEREGLWGELFMMREAGGFRFWASSWHSETTRRFDFSAGSRRVEVKSTIGQVRIHHFAHRQVYAQLGEEIFIASALLREDDVGLSLRQLIDECREALRGTSEALKLERALRSAAMEDPVEAGPVFDAREARQNLAWYRAVDAPQFRMPEPPGVTETRYRVDLSGAPRVAEDDLQHWLNQWSSAMAVSA